MGTIAWDHQTSRDFVEHVGGNPDLASYDVGSGMLKCPDVDQATMDAAAAGWGSRAPTTAEVTLKITGLSMHARNLIEDGLQSTAGGKHATAKWYDSMVEDQLNLVGNVSSEDLATASLIHPYRDTKGGPKTYTQHTRGQLQAVLKDGRERKLAILQEFNALKAQCLAATTVDELSAITWTMV